MGAWGYGNFDNDTVLDWIGDLVETEGLELISEFIEMVLDDGDLDADTASSAIGAIEVLAALHNRPATEQHDDEDLEEWIEQHKGQGANLLEVAQKALRKILAESELKDLWEETEHYEDWVNAVKELENRLVV